MSSILKVRDAEGNIIEIPVIQGLKGDKGDTGVQGEKGNIGPRGLQGEKGIDGISIIKSEVNASGELVLTYSDGTSTNLGVVVGANGKDGTNGTSVTIQHVNESAEDSGNNTITFSDGSTLTVKNGSKGSTPVKGTDYFTEADKSEIANLVLEMLPDGDEVSY